LFGRRQPLDHLDVQRKIVADSDFLKVDDVSFSDVPSQALLFRAEGMQVAMLAEYILRASADGDIEPAITCVASVFGEDGRVVDEWSSKINGLLSDREQAFWQAEALRIARMPLLSLSNAADALTKAVEDILDVGWSTIGCRRVVNFCHQRL
jgi:hypothetical protein